MARRGDLSRSQEDSLYFTSIGFLAADNPGLLYRNAVREIKGTATYIEITIPYFRADMPTTPLVPDVGNELAISFGLVGKDAVVLEGGTPVTQGDLFTFHDGTNPFDRDFTIEKTDPITGNVSSRVFTVSVRKEIIPTATLIQHPLYDDPPIGPPKPAVAIDLYFVDERGDTIPIAGALNPIFNDGFDNLDGVDDDQLWLADSSGFGEDDFERDIQADFTSWAFNPDTPEHYIADARLYNQGGYKLAVPGDLNYFNFVDADGYDCRRVNDTVQSTSWVSDAVYVANWGTVGNSGLVKTEPVPTLAEAFTVMAAAIGGGDPRFEIRVAEGTYDLGAGFTIDRNVSIYGGYRTDFSGRWNMEDPNIREDHATLFFGTPPAGGGIANVNGVLTWQPAAAGPDVYDTSTLDGVVILAADAGGGGQDWTAALVLKNGPTGEIVSPEIRHCTFSGGGGGGLNSFGVVLQDAGNPLFFNNLIFSAQVTGSGLTAGLLANLGGGFVAAGNTIIGNQSGTDSSYGVRLINADADFIVNRILGGPSASADSVGLSSVSAAYLRAYANDIEANNAVGASSAVSLEIPVGTHYIYNNVLVAGDGGQSIGVRTIDAGGGQYEIFNNAIRTASGAAGNSGLFMAGAAPANMEFLNNLVDSTSNDLTAIETDLGLDASGAGMSIFANAFDDSDHDVQVGIEGAGPDRDATQAQDDYPTFLYNIEKSFAFNDNGRLTSGLDANLAYGGVSGWTYTSEPAPWFLNEDLRGRSRSDDFFFPEPGGWSIGPYEYNESDTARPPAVHVAEGRGVGGPGSDKYLLGTAEYPFEFVATGYNAAADRLITTGDVWDIRVAEGAHSVGDLMMFNDARLLGGWTPNFATRNYNVNITTLVSNAPAMFYLDGVSDRFLMEGFTLRSDLGGNADLIHVLSFSYPTLRHLDFEASAVNTGYTGLMVYDTATPLVYDCTFDGSGMANGAIEHAAYYDNAGGTFRNNRIIGGAPVTGSIWSIRVNNNASPVIHHNTIDGGSPGGGGATMIEVTGGWPEIYDNNLTGGTVNGGDARGIYWSAPSGPDIYGNTIRSGFTNTSDAMAVFVDGAGAFPRFIDNTIIAEDGVGSTSWGIRVNNGSPEIIDNRIQSTVGSLTFDVYGISVFNGGAFIEDNDIDIGVSVTESAGIQVTNSSPIIIGNTVTGGSSGGFVYGIQLTTANATYIGGNNVIVPGAGIGAEGLRINNSSNVIVEDLRVSGGTGDITTGVHILNGSNQVELRNSRIFGGDGAIESTGLRLENCNEARILNNLVHGGRETGGERKGIRVDGGDPNTALYNNTVYAGRTGGADSAAIHLAPGSAPRITNNLIIAASGGGDTLGVRQESALLPSIFRHNLIIGAEPGFIAYRDSGLTDRTNNGELNTWFTGAGGGAPAHDNYFINVTDDPTDYLRRFTRNGDWSDFINDDWRLSGGGSVNAPGGGELLDGDAVWPFNFDFTGGPRSNPWSIGAYEF